MRRFFSRLLIFLGILLILGAGGLTGYNLWDDYRAGSQSSEIIDQLTELMENSETDDTAARGDSKETTAESDDSEATEEIDSDNPAAAVTDSDDVPLYELNPEVSMPVCTVDGDRYIGVLYIPSLKLKLPVMDSWDYTKLKKSPCRYSGSVYTHDIVIAGHNYARHFAMVKRVPVGTEITFTDMDGNVFNYTVSAIETISPTNVTAMIDDSTDSWDMTLFTCTTGGSARCAIRCVLQ